MYKTTFLENWGSGAQRIIETCRSQGLEEPAWTTDGGFVTVTFKRPISHKTAGDTPKHHLSTTQAPPKYHPSTDQVARLIRLMGEQYLTMKEMADLCGLKNLHHFRDAYIAPALSDGAIERLYPEQPKHPKQKYCLTEKAKEWKSNVNKNS